MIDSLLWFGRDSPVRTLSHERACSLHRAYPKRDDYKYDLASKQARADERFEELSRSIDLGSVGTVTELGAGDGRLALRFLKEGFVVNIIDTMDWRDEDVREADIAFHRVGERDPHPLSDDSTDLLLSFGTFEHVPDPDFVLSEMLRVTRPGGVVFLEFGPLHHSPWGLHAYRTFHAPYAQFLLSEESLQDFIRENGVHDLGTPRDSLQFVNGWSLQEYRKLFRSYRDRIEMLRLEELSDHEELGMVYRNLKCFRGRGLTCKDLTTEMIIACFAIK